MRVHVPPVASAGGLKGRAVSCDLGLQAMLQAHKLSFEAGGCCLCLAVVT